jgi:tetratricopeptide (TPR) repeat protein
MWRLDLSFSLGSLGAAKMTSNDLAGARRDYEEAVALREKAAAEDPNEDFAKLAVARGYQRLALIHERLGDAATSMSYSQKRAQVYRQRLTAHPGRETVWTDFTQHVFDAAHGARRAIEASTLPAAERRRLASMTSALLDEVASVQAGWLKKKPGSPSTPSPAAMAEERSRLAALLR